MTYSCAIFSRGAKTLEEAQEEKLETVARKLALKEGDRVLDVGCGWGSFPLWAATKHGASVVGITLSAAAGREGAAAGRGGRASPTGSRSASWTTATCAGERFDAIASIGMVEHVGAAQIDVYAQHPRRAARAGRAAAQPRHHPPAPHRRRGGRRSPSATSSPTPPRCTSRATCWRSNGPASSPTTSRTSRADYAETLRHWAQRLDENLDEAIRLAGPERVRVWRLYLRAARNGFEIGFTSIYQARCSLG